MITLYVNTMIYFISWSVVNKRGSQLLHLKVIGRQTWSSDQCTSQKLQGYQLQYVSCGRHQSKDLVDG